MKDKITTQEVARRLGKSQQFVRIGLQRGTLPFGYAVKTSSRWSYQINEAALEGYINGMSDPSIYKTVITVEHAAWLMGKTIQFVQLGLQQKTLPFGSAVQMDSYTWDYYISPKLFSEYTGISFNGKE